MKNFELKLLSLGGIRVDLEITGWGGGMSELVTGGRVFRPLEENAVLVKMLENRCHDNVVVLRDDVPELEIWTGYALSQSGVWQNHSWCFHPVWKMLIETTVPFQVYLGVGMLEEANKTSVELCRALLKLPEQLSKRFWEEAHKKCSKCGVEQLLTEFRPNTSGWRRNDCRACERGVRQRAYDSDPEKSAAASRKWSKENPEKRNATKRAYNKKYPEKLRAFQRSSMYGLKPEQYAEMLDVQNNKCAVCDLTFDKTCRVNTPHVDHCHVTGKVRGLLCGNCNSGIGKLKDSFSILIQAADYIRKNS